MRVVQLPYRPDSVALFEAIAAEPWAVFLDSGRPHACGGRWDILAARPYATLVTRGAVTEIRTRTGVHTESDDPLNILRSQLGTAEPVLASMPFAGGAIGYFAYDLARTLGDLPSHASDQPPAMAVGLYDWAVLVDHEARVTQLVAAERDDQTGRDWDHLIELFSRPPAPLPGGYTILSAPVSNLTRAGYDAAFERAKHYIAAGDCYQINLTQRYTAQVGGSRWALYRALRQLNPAPFSAYLNHPEAQVLSTSPERFIELRGNRVTTQPIKGTRPRDPDPVRDRELANALAHSDKDRAENLMIVDLLRNDLGKVCQTGSVAVSDLFTVASFAHVHHLVSTVSGRLRPDSDAIDLLRACFPGGSITGAPKRRAMAIIDELEPDPRGLYCGAIGYIGFNGDMDANIAIRTLIGAGDTVSFGVGGAIVADSEVAAEYRECLDKAAPLLRVLR